MTINMIYGPPAVPPVAVETYQDWIALAVQLATDADGSELHMVPTLEQHMPRAWAQRIAMTTMLDHGCAMFMGEGRTECWRGPE